MPMLAPTNSSWPSMTNGAESLSRILLAMTTTSSRVRTSGNSSVNSSPPKSRQRVAAAQATLQSIRDGLQQPVAHRMTERIVDDLEAVEIEEHHREPSLVPPRLRDREVQAVFQQRAVRQVRQQVVVRLEIDHLLGFFALRDVARRAERAEERCRACARSASAYMPSRRQIHPHRVRLERTAQVARSGDCATGARRCRDARSPVRRSLNRCRASVESSSKIELRIMPAD